MLFSLYATIKMMHGPINIRRNEYSAVAQRPHMAHEWAIMTAALAYCGVQ